MQKYSGLFESTGYLVGSKKDHDEGSSRDRVTRGQTGTCRHSDSSLDPNEPLSSKQFICVRPSDLPLFIVLSLDVADVLCRRNDVAEEAALTQIQVDQLGHFLGC